ncbi:MAG TPA: hypothetical protein VH720_09175 [Candidatus Limnocylindrales bacterium]|jgi:hypothetical protein
MFTFQHSSTFDAAPARESEALPVAYPDVEFVAYGEDCIVVARVALPTERLTDLLNSQERYRITDVVADSLTDGHAYELPEVELQRDELFLVHAAGPRGNPGRRKRTRQHSVVLQLGPYLVHGQFHAVPGSDPLEGLRRRKAMVPLTDATIEFVVGRAVQQRHVETLIVNRELMDWAVEAHDEGIEFPELEVPAATGRLAKDFTGQISTHIEAA